MLETVTRVYDKKASTGILKLRAENVKRVGDLVVLPVLVSGRSAFGAEVFGVDWNDPIPEGVVKQLIKLQDKYAVPIFRQTGLDNARHIAFSRQLGEKLEINPFFYGRENDRVGEPLLFDVGKYVSFQRMLISNSTDERSIELDGSLVKSQSRRWHHSMGNALWHTDSTYHQQRSKYSLLLSHGDAVTGGCYTHFADTRQAYADLRQDMKDELENLIIEHDLWHSRKLARPIIYSNPTEREKALKPPAYHRLVQVAPDGRKTLYLAAHAKRIVGRSFENSQKLIWQLIDHCTQPKYVFSMEWLSGGDMVWWDNRQSMHRSNPYTESMSARDVRRSTVIDDGPLAFGVEI
ncbi:putative alpha-ketoglutarate-dependent 2,4-dichlorophenoxyacetate dioxygenase [Aureobasidium subglaciale]|nr:putative alpha-ketoglutarate-dependent 2,4-dichlorophenoxyacetate dioxygenase [Aureobasidium subglaciale]